MALFRRSSVGWKDLVFWALDLETAGLSASRHAILAVGMVPIRTGLIQLGEAYETLVCPAGDLVVASDAVAAHHILPAEARAATPLAEVLPQIDRRLREGIVLLHHARLDKAFLKRAYATLDTRWPNPTTVDTVALIWKWASRERFLASSQAEPSVNLADARRRFGLPAYPAHDALIDAIATAELFLALRARLGARTLRELL